MVTTFESSCDSYTSSMCHRIVHCFPAISIFIAHHSYQFILNLRLSGSVLSFNQNSSTAYIFLYMSFSNSSYMILQPLSSVVMYFMYSNGSMQSSSSSVSLSKLKSVVPMVSSVFNKPPCVYYVDMFIYS